jgi:hypothetical protein
MKALSSCIFWMCVFSMLNQICLAQQVKQTEKDKFGFFQCRADAQKWTFDPFDKTLAPKYITGTAVMVNGQFRVHPHLSYGVTMRDLIQRTYEMGVCTHEDAKFEKQFTMYSLMEKLYSEEQTFRYMNFIMKHHLDEQFAKEDKEEFE